MKKSEFLDEIAGDNEYLIAYLYFQDNILPEIWQEEDEYFESIALDIDHKIEMMRERDWCPDEPQY